VQKNSNSSNTNSKQKSQSVIIAELDPKIQFVYEIAFAKRELLSLYNNVEIKLDDTIKFELKSPIDELLQISLLKRLAYFQNIGERNTEYFNIISKNKTKSDNQYLTHWFYPYKGKYHPRLIRSIFNILKLNFGQTILDPFLGSGTTTLEAHLFGLNSIGFDISPICIIISKVKVTCGEIAEQLPLYSKNAIKAMKNDFIANKNISYTNTKLINQDDDNYYKKFLDSIKDERIKNFYLLGQLIFASDRGRRNRQFDSFEKNLNRMIESALDLAKVEKEFQINNNPKERRLGKTQIEIGDARSLNLNDESIDAIITSPPYSIALNYMENDKYALRELEVNKKELSNLCIGVKGTGKNKCELYEKDMKQSYNEMYRVLKNKMYCVVVIGDSKVDGIATKTVEKAIDHCQSIGFILKDNIPKKIFGLYNTISDEKVLFFQKSNR
jgi:tRNA G10  N-methylase Trm11